MYHRPEVLVPAKEAAKYPQPLSLEVMLYFQVLQKAAACTRTGKVKEHFMPLNGNEIEKVLRASKWSNKRKIK